MIHFVRWMILCGQFYWLLPLIITCRPCWQWLYTGKYRYDELENRTWICWVSIICGLLASLLVTTISNSIIECMNFFQIIFYFIHRIKVLHWHWLVFTFCSRNWRHVLLILACLGWPSLIPFLVYYSGWRTWPSFSFLSPCTCLPSAKQANLRSLTQSSKTNIFLTKGNFICECNLYPYELVFN